MAVQSHVFSKFLFQLRSPLILVTAPEIGWSSSYSQYVMGNRSLLIVCYFYQSSEWSPMGRKGTGLKFVTRPVYVSPQFRNNPNTVYLNPIYIYLLHVLSTRHVGITHHRVLQTSGQGWTGSKAVHGME